MEYLLLVYLEKTYQVLRFEIITDFSSLQIHLQLDKSNELFNSESRHLKSVPSKFKDQFNVISHQ